MKRTALPLLILAAAFLTAGVWAQDSGQTPAPAPKQTKEQKKAAWESGVKQDCSAEIATGGVCAGKDFSAGLMECLRSNRKTLSDGCKAVLHRKHGHGGKKNAAAPTTPPANAAPAQQ